MKRCNWAGSWEEVDKIMTEYHDNEWGVPLHDDQRLFEMLILEGFQAGLSWSTIIKKRENFRKAFDGFKIKKVSNYDNKKISKLLSDAGIVRNRLKIQAAISNALKFLEIQQEFGSFDNYIWGFVNGKPLVNHFKKISEVPPRTVLSDKISEDLKKRGFRFVGSTIIYAYIQAIGLVNDHTADCFRYKELTARKRTA